MQIREHALNIQILMPIYNPITERKTQKFVSSFSRGITDPDEAIREVENGLESAKRKLEDEGIRIELVLTEQDRQKIRDHIVNRESRRGDYKRMKFPKEAPNNFLSAAKSVKPNGENMPKEDTLLQAYKTISRGMVTDKYISEMFVTAAIEAKEGLKRNELPEEDADEIIRAWLLLKKQLDRQGFTVAWFNKRKRMRREED